MEQKLKEYLSGKRLRHSFGVRDTALELAHRFNGCADKAVVAGLLHDAARHLPADQVMKIIREDRGINRRAIPSCLDSPLGEEMARSNPAILHAEASSIIARVDFKIDDAEILRSIALHTTGAPEMGTLDKIVFVADYIEPGRSFDGVEKARELARQDLDGTVRYILKATIRKLLGKERPICALTFDAYNYFMLRRP
jgi:predicted HD superfamily hydrolase involved in NAD metabolism